MPTFDEDVIINGSLTVNLGGGKKLKIQTSGAGNAGRLEFGGNELSIISDVDDPPKLRLAAPTAGLGAVSFNYLAPTGVQHEVAMLTGKLSEGDPVSLGGQVEHWARVKRRTGDSAMVRMGVISAAFDTELKVRWWPNLGPWNYTMPGSDPNFVSPYVPFGSPPPPPPPPGQPTIVSKNNLNGSNSALTVGDGSWLTAINSNLDTDLVVDVPSNGTTLQIEARRTTTGTPSPYIYVKVDGVTVLSHQIGNTTAATMLPNIAVANGGTRRVEINVSAQAGTVEFGGVRIV